MIGCPFIYHGRGVSFLRGIDPSFSTFTLTNESDNLNYWVYSIKTTDTITTLKSELPRHSVGRGPVLSKWSFGSVTR